MSKINNIHIKIAVAMSGGVDSSVAALLLLKEGYQVFGVHMDINEDKVSSEAAQTVCDRLGIELRILDLRQDFQKEVKDYFLSAYQKGTTPNPCVECNRLIKFGRLWQEAKKLGADKMATGHYVRQKQNNQAPSLSLASSSQPYEGQDKTPTALLKAKDSNKDQSYFLYTLNQEQISQAVFPLGDMAKDEVRKLADQAGLPYIKSESQDVCFLSSDESAANYLKRFLVLQPGLIKTLDGKKVGEHQGLPLYTIGQRKGIEIGGIGPFYAVRLDYETNTLYVVNDCNDPALFQDEFIIRDANWTSGYFPAKPFVCETVIRYRHQPVSALVSPDKNAKGDIYRIKLKEPQRAVTLGQSAVFYKGEELLGGGIIDK